MWYDWIFPAAFYGFLVFVALLCLFVWAENIRAYKDFHP